MTFTSIALSDADRWNETLAGIAHVPAQTHWFTAAIALTHPEPVGAFSARESGASAFCVIKQRRFKDAVDVTTPYGFGGFSSTLPGADAMWRASAHAQGWICAYLALHPLLPHPFGDEVREGDKSYYILDLQRPPEAIFAAMQRTHRARLRQSLEKDLHVMTDKTLLARYLCPLYAQTLARTQAGPLVHFSEATMMALLHHPQCIALGIGEERDVPQAIILVPFTGLIGDYLLNGSNDAGRRYTRRLLWHAMEMLSARGVKWFNLGGGVNALDSLDDFKKGFGGVAMPMRHVQHIYDTAAFNRLCAQKGVEATSSGYFPPYR